MTAEDDLDVGVPKGEGTDPDDVEPHFDRLARSLPYFNREVALVALKHNGRIVTQSGNYADDESHQHQIDEYYKRNSGGVVQLLGDFNGFACFRYVQRDGGLDAANDYGSVAMVTWDRWGDEFEHVEGGI